jgi:Na+-transporting methylmalonyl-CoA/oxaloacetate decarboxylase gamma subunit
VPDAVSEILQTEIDQSGLIEVISAAVSQHRKKSKKKKEKVKNSK